MVWSSTSGPVPAASSGPERILLFGSAHVVDLSVPLRERLSSIPLQGIALELDAERSAVLQEPTANPPSPRGSGPLLIVLWRLLQRRLGEQMGQGAGAEMRVAATVARERHLPVFLIDDPFALTVRRLLGSLSFPERVRLVLGAVLGLVIPPRAVERELDQYSATPGDYMDRVREALPTVARVLIDERNEHMAARLEGIWRQGFHQVAVVVGDAHVPGLAAALRGRQLPVETVPLRELRPPVTAPSATPSTAS